MTFTYAPGDHELLFPGVTRVYSNFQDAARDFKRQVFPKDYVLKVGEDKPPVKWIEKECESKQVGI